MRAQALSAILRENLPWQQWFPHQQTKRSSGFCADLRMVGFLEQHSRLGLLFRIRDKDQDAFTAFNIAMVILRIAPFSQNRCECHVDYQ